MCILITSLIILPLNFAKDLSFLGFTSIVGTVGTIYTVLVLVFELPSFGVCDTWEPFVAQPGLFVMIPAVTFAFNGHFNAPQLYQQLKERTPSRWLLVTSLSFALCGLLTVTCSVCGYLTLGTGLLGKGQSNVLDAPQFGGRAEVMVAYIATTFSVALCAPLNLVCVRDGLDGLWTRNFEPRFGLQSTPNTRHWAFSAIGVVFTFSMAMFFSELGTVVALNGAVCATLIMFVFPSLMYLKCLSMAGTQKLPPRVTLVPCTAIVIGVVVGVCGVATTSMVTFGLGNHLIWNA